jgi:murein DD-endopeptidase MepM/ murein hydrolase activator NlpD
MDSFIRGNKYFIIILVLLIYLATKKYTGNSNDIWVMPVEGIITQEFKGDKHHGIDIGCGTTNIHASQKGIVSFSGWSDIYGNHIIISHGEKIISLYGHNSENLVKVGDNVEQGDVIAISGNTGRSFGIHCHMEIRVNNICVNPMDYLTKDVDNHMGISDPEFDVNSYLPQNI